MSATAIERRALLLGSLGLLATSTAPVWARPLFSSYPFTLGVAAGDPWPDGFVIWTRLAPEPLAEAGGMPRLAVPVAWEVAEDANFLRIAAKGETLARPELGHAIHVELAGLSPARPYFYRFFIVQGEASPVGRARTAPAAERSVRRVRIASAGCQNYEHGYFSAYGHLAREHDLDFVYHYGDYIYEGAGGIPTGAGEAGLPLTKVRSHIGGEIYTIEDYRRRYAQYRLDADLQAAHASAAFVMAYDDHEIDNDWAGMNDQDGTPPEVFALRKAAALQAWYENLPVRFSQLPRGGHVKLHRRLDYGDLIRVHVLDTRGHRDKQLCDARGKTACRREDTAAATMLGAAQEAWLGEGLDSPQRWNFLAQQIMVMPYDFRKEWASTPWTSSDDWIGYPAARARLIEAIRSRGLTNVIIGTGNSHRHIAAHVPVNDADPTGPAAAVEFLSTSISSSGDSDLPWTGLKAMMRNNPHMALMSLQRGYQIYDVTPELWTTEIKVMDQVGRPGGAISTLARFAVSPRRPKIERA